MTHQITKRSSNYRGVLIAFLLLYGVAFRLIAASLGYTYDMESYSIVGKLAVVGENVYAHTTRYNYGPVWAYILGAMYNISTLSAQSFVVFRFGIALFLSVVDVGIFIFLMRYFGAAAGLLFYLNPLTIILTGYNSHFDNLAVFTALFAVHLYSQSTTPRYAGKLASYLLLGVSLMIKHIFFAFPVWLAVREKRWKDRVLALIVPYGIFAMSFLPFLRESAQSILENVFLYVSFKNAPLWHVLILNGFPRLGNEYMLFVGALAIGAVVFRRKPIMHALLLYTMVLVIFSVAIADQYFSIILPFIGVFFNVFFLFFVFLQTLYMWVVVSGGEVYAPFLGHSLDRSVIGYSWQISLLFIGFMYVLIKPYIRTWTGRRWIAILVGLDLVFTLAVIVPNYLENNKAIQIEAAIAQGNYERANALYSQIEKSAPLAGSRFWYKLVRSRYYVEYFRKFVYARDLSKDGLDSTKRGEIESLLKNMPPDYRFAKEVRDMLESVHE